MLYRILLFTCISSYAVACDHPSKNPKEISQDDFVVMDSSTIPDHSLEIITKEINALRTQIHNNSNLNHGVKFSFECELAKLERIVSNVSYIENPLVPRKDQSSATKNSIDQASLNAKFTLHKSWEKIKKDIAQVLS